MHHPYVLLLSLALVSFTVLANQPDTISLVAPITKDTSTSLYSITLNYVEKYVIDLDAPFLWRYCQFPPQSLIPCSSPQCYAGQSCMSPKCPLLKNRPKSDSKCNCVATPTNPIAKECALSNLASSYVIMSMTNGINPTDTTNFGSFLISCAPKTLMKSLPKDAVGVAGLSQAPISIPSQLNSASYNNRKVPKKFALCLPSKENSKGVIVFGDVQICFLPPGKFNLVGILSYTPLIKHPKSPDYYIGLKGISINGKSSYFGRNTFQLDISSGNGGVKISTTVPYTVLRSDIYKTFVSDFAAAIPDNIPRAMKRGPFDLCVNTSRIGWLSAIPFPHVDFELGDGKNWTMYTPNSMVDMGESIACLAFVDGGMNAKEAIVIGSYQMENHLLLFDIDASRLGFSLTLLYSKTSCSSFNFTQGT